MAKLLNESDDKKVVATMTTESIYGTVVRNIYEDHAFINLEEGVRESYVAGDIHVKTTIKFVN
ncbi:hypothetical protein BCSAG_49350 [Bacillus cereus]